MSRFFRTADSTSSSDSDSDTGGEDDTNRENLESTDDDHKPTNDSESSISVPAATSVDLNQHSADWTNHHRDFLLHALLEERCMNEVLTSDRRASRDQADVQAQATAKYQQLCADLASYNLISAGLDGDQHAITRQRYRDGLNVLSSSSRRSQAGNAVPAPLRRLLTNNETTSGATVADRGNSAGPISARSIPVPARRLIEIPDPNLSILDLTRQFSDTLSQRNVDSAILRSRYHDDFEEIGMLGRGGYGMVYHVRHRLDNQVYAVKKVPLGAARLHRIQKRGEAEVHEVLRELRTLAKLDHPNVVRYYNGWIEWVESTAPTPVSQSGADSRDVSAVVGAEMSETGEDRIITEASSSSATGIVFETSESVTGSHEAEADNRLRRVETKSTIAAVSDEIESVDREFEPTTSFQSQSAASGIHFAEPTLAIHVQMSLSAMTLADFIAPPVAGTDATILPLAHCFHIEPSTSILLSILDGLEYLHGEGIVHRDIKPANIFLSPCNNPRAVTNFVDLISCSDCEAEKRQYNPIKLEVRIGDFGLVAVADPDSGASNPSEAVGTEIYRPLSTSAGVRHPSLDMYALGIIAFELVWKFDTRMERMHILRHLKQEGEFPVDFVNEPMKEVIKSMLEKDGTAVTIPQLRQKLAGVIAGHKYAA